VFKDLYDAGLPPPHPGEILREDILPRLALPRSKLAAHLGISARRLADVLAERAPVTLDLAQRLGAALGSGTQYWLGLQVQYDVWRAQFEAPVRIKPVAWAARAPRYAA
jgi:antitoxin HigA-1